MELTARRAGPDAFVTAVGDMDVDTAYDVYAAVTEQAGTAQRVVLDLAAVRFIDSVGISMLVRCRDELPTGSGCAFSLGHCSDAVTSLLELTGLAEHFSRFDDRCATHPGNSDAAPNIEDPDLAAGEMLHRRQN